MLAVDRLVAGGEKGARAARWRPASASDRPPAAGGGRICVSMDRTRSYHRPRRENARRATAAGYGSAVATRDSEIPAAAAAKPLLRGVSHQAGFVAAVPLGVTLALAAEGPRELVSAGVFGASVTAMFGASALYHRGTWAPLTRRRLRRLDHAGVYGLIAGTYTPIGLLVLTGAWRITMLAIVWAGALAGICLRLVWAEAPKWLAALIGIGLGWVGVLVLPQLVDRIGIVASALLLAGGLCYTLGAIVYVRGRPDPFPGVFGYHEVFHVLVIVAVGLQYAVIAFFVLPRS